MPPPAPALPEADRLLSLRLRQLAQSRAAETIAAAYERLYTAVHDPSNGYPDPKAIAPHTPAVVRDLLNLY